MRLVMKDLKKLAEGDMVKDSRKMHDYKGFTVEPIFVGQHVLTGYVILIYGRRHIFYLCGQSGGDLSIDVKKAKTFRTVEFCHSVIDEIITDHAQWVKTLHGRDPKPTDLMPNEPF